MAKRKLNVVIGKYDPRGSKLGEHFMSEMQSYPYLIEYANNEANGLDVQLRGNYINIYYKGGNLIDLSGKQVCGFDENYFYLPEKNGLRMTDIERLCHPDFKTKKGDSKALKEVDGDKLLALREEAIAIKNYIAGQRDELVDLLKSCNSVESVGVIVEKMKTTMDNWKDRLTKNGIRKSVVGERTVQHYISLQNKKFDEKTDFLVLDLEYAISTNAVYAMETAENDRENQPRIDILAIEKGTGQVYVMELKYGMKSVEGDASAEIHYNDFLASVGDDSKCNSVFEKYQVISSDYERKYAEKSKWEVFLEDVKILLKSKQDNGIIDKDIKIVNSKPKFAFIYKKEEVSDDKSFEKYLEKLPHHIPTLYLPCEKEPENPSVLGYKLSKEYIK